MAHLVEAAKGLAGKFVKTFTGGSSEQLAIAMIDQIVLAHNGIVTNLDAFLAHVDTGDVAGIGNTNVATYGVSAYALSQTASDQLIQSPKKENI